MDLKERILYYLVLYNGRSKPVKEIVEQDIILEVSIKEQDRYLYNIGSCFLELEKEGKIKLIPYSEMNCDQRFAYDRDKDTIYEIINK